MEIHAPVLMRAATDIGAAAATIMENTAACNATVAGLPDAFGNDDKGAQLKKQFADYNKKITTFINAFVSDLTDTQGGLEAMAGNTAAADSASTVQAWDAIPDLPSIPTTGL
jgi:hypothetical protein